MAHPVAHPSPGTGPYPETDASVGTSRTPPPSLDAGDGAAGGQPLRVWVDQDLCTGDGLCVQYAPSVFEFDVDGLAYVKDGDGELRTDPGAAVPVPVDLVDDVVDSARDCPGECIHVTRVGDGVEVARPEASA